MIYITGDTHGEFARFLDYSPRGGHPLSKGDTLLICGDFGFLFRCNEQEKAQLDRIAEFPYTVAFVDGNHENFTAIYSYPCEEWNGGRVHRIRKNILHLMRGELYTIEGHRFFTMGGGYSRDKYRRVEGYSWWPEELPIGSEYHHAADTLRANGMETDYILTHTAPREIIRRLGNVPDREEGELTGFLEWIMYEVKFKKWFFGHFHTDTVIDDRFTALWFHTETIND